MAANDENQKIPSLYERHPKRCDIAEGVCGIALGALTLFTQPSIEAVITQGSEPSAGDWIAFVVTTVLYAFYILFFIKLKSMRHSAIDDRNAEIATLRKQVDEEILRRVQAEALKDCSERVLWGVAALARRNAQIANDAVHAIEEKGVSELPARSFDDDCRSVCKLLREQLNHRYGPNVNFEVSYVAREERGRELAVKMVAGNATLHGERFTVEGVTRRSSDADKRYDLLLFEQHDRAEFTSEGVRVLLSKEEVGKAFSSGRAKNRGRKKDASSGTTKEYTQYVALPVVCPAVEGQTEKKMVGLLQVAVVGGKVWKDQKAAKSMAGDYMIPLGCQLLLIHKLRNSLRAVPKKSSEKP